MANITIICGLILVSMIHQSTAGPNNNEIFNALKGMLTALKNVDPNALTAVVDAFNKKITDNAPWYTVHHEKFFDETTTMATTIYQTFQQSSYFANDPEQARKKQAVKTAVKGYIDIFRGNTKACPGCAKFQEILNQVSN